MSHGAHGQTELMDDGCTAMELMVALLMIDRSAPLDGQHCSTTSTARWSAPLNGQHRSIVRTA